MPRPGGLKLVLANRSVPTVYRTIDPGPAGTLAVDQLMAVDGIFPTTGSISFDSRSLDIDAHESLPLHDRIFASVSEAAFADVPAHADKTTLQDSQDRDLEKGAAGMLSRIREPYCSGFVTAPIRLPLDGDDPR